MSATLKAIQSEQHAFVHHRLGWMIVRFLVAAVLLTAAGLKALATTPDFGNSIIEARWFQILLIESEIALALILLFGLVPKISWFVTTILFTIFSLVSLAKGFSGAESCGCFGDVVKINPFVTFLLDAGIVALLCKFRPKYEKIELRFEPHIVLNYLLVFVPLGGFMLWETSQVRFQQLQGTGQRLQEGNIVKLEPQMWIDKEFPLSDYCDIGEKFTTGHWLILLHRTGCAECRKASPLIAKLVKEKNCPLAVLEMNPTKDKFHINNVDFITGLLNQKMTWFAETPVVLELDNGVVKQVLFREDFKRMQ
jgi:thiol-disulfide isomerase/thioredoxin